MPRLPKAGDRNRTGDIQLGKLRGRWRKSCNVRHFERWRVRWQRQRQRATLGRPGGRVDSVLPRRAVRRPTACPRGVPRVGQSARCGTVTRDGHQSATEEPSASGPWGGRAGPPARGLQGGRGGADAWNRGCQGTWSIENGVSRCRKRQEGTGTPPSQNARSGPHARPRAVSPPADAGGLPGKRQRMDGSSPDPRSAVAD
jgi:hypothetical protein